MFILNNGEFHITNICNYNCESCSNLSNYHFNGHLKWNDYKDIYTKWSTRVNIVNLGIMGGEPMLNPDFINWVQGLKELWPSSKLIIVTNGSRFKYWEKNDLYNVLADLPGTVEIKVSAHNTEDYKDLNRYIVNDFLKDPYKVPVEALIFKDAWDNIKDASWPEFPEVTTLSESVIRNFLNSLPHTILEEVNAFGVFNELKPFSNDYRYIDNNIQVSIGLENMFYKTSVVEFKDSYEFKVSDQEEAWEKCWLDCYGYFYNGELYKCSTSALYPAFYNQFNVNLTDYDKEMLFKYKPLKATDSTEMFTKFFDDLLTASIPTCRFCTVTKDKVRISASTKKVKGFKR